MNSSISQLASEIRVSALTLIKLCRKTGISYRPNPEEVEILERHLSNYYNLENLEIRTLHDFMESEEAIDVLEEISPFISLLPEDETEKILKYVSQKLYDVMPDSELKNKIKPETLYETIMNLGIVKIFRSGFSNPDGRRLPPVSLLGFDSQIYYHLVKVSFIKEMEVYSINGEMDFDDLEKKLEGLKVIFKEHSK